MKRQYDSSVKNKPSMRRVLMVDGRQKEFFSYFPMLAVHPDRIDLDASARAYSTREALRSGNDWFRAFASDTKFNAGFSGLPSDVPLLYVPGL